ncbi:MAG: hypothetical protein ACJ71N_11740 [Terriglobales bacterium]|jgi:hypothetical protein
MNREKNSPKGRAEENARGKKPYKKPAFQHEKVFETMALACGKISGTQASCRANRKNS